MKANLDNPPIYCILVSIFFSIIPILSQYYPNIQIQSSEMPQPGAAIAIFSRPPAQPRTMSSRCEQTKASNQLEFRIRADIAEQEQAGLPRVKSQMAIWPSSYMLEAASHEATIFVQFGSVAFVQRIHAGHEDVCTLSSTFQSSFAVDPHGEQALLDKPQLLKDLENTCFTANFEGAQNTNNKQRRLIETAGSN